MDRINANDLTKLPHSTLPLTPSHRGRGESIVFPLPLWERVRACPERSEGVRGM